MKKLLLAFVTISFLSIASLYFLNKFGLVVDPWQILNLYTLFLIVVPLTIYIKHMFMDGDWRHSIKGRYKQHAFRLFIFVIFICLNYWLLRDYNTLRWPYLWPKPGLFIVLAFILIVGSFYRQMSKLWAFRVVGLIMILIGQSYLLHSLDIFLTHFSIVSAFHLLGTIGATGVMFLNYFNQFQPKNNVGGASLPNELPVVAAIIPTYNESLEILENTICSLKELDYPKERLHIIISDDGHRNLVEHLASTHHVHYNPGARRDAKAGNLNSAIRYIEEHFPETTLILTQDADELIHPSFLKKTVGYFSDPLIAFVQTPKESITPNKDPFGSRDRVFYDNIQPGRNGSGAAFSCGSGVIWRMEAINAIGGFVTWNLVEDLTTSYTLHCAGYRSQYLNEVLTIGLSPDDIPNLLKQRGTWAADTWRLFLFKQPLTQTGLTLRQRLQYLELGLFYVTAVFFIPSLMMVPLLALATRNYLPISGSALFPWMVMNNLYYAILSRGKLTSIVRMWQYWVGHWPTYTKGFWIAIRSRNKKPSYKVTRKTRQSGFFGHLLWPQFLYIVIGALLSLRALFWMPIIDVMATWTNIGIFCYFAVMLGGICRAAFYNIEWPKIPRLLNKSSTSQQQFEVG